MSRNKFKFRREIIAAGGIASTGGLQISAASTFDGLVTFNAGIADKVQALTDTHALKDTSTGGTAILGYGVTTITVTGATGGSTANDLAFKLNPPIKAGVFKRIYVTGTSASTKVVSVRTNTSLLTFFGSTKNSIAFTTTVNSLGHAFPILLDGLSTSQWAVCGLPGTPSTASALAGATA